MLFTLEADYHVIQDCSLANVGFPDSRQCSHKSGHQLEPSFGLRVASCLLNAPAGFYVAVAEIAPSEDLSGNFPTLHGAWCTVLRIQDPPKSELLLVEL